MYPKYDRYLQNKGSTAYVQSDSAVCGILCEQIANGGKTQNILDVANMFKGKYALKFKNKDGKKIDVKISIIPIELCEFKGTPLNLVVVHGFGELPMMLITSLSSDDRNICVDVCKVYLMRWRIEEYFKFKKQSFDYENLRVRSLQSIRTLDFLLTMAIGYVSILSDKDNTVILRLEIIGET